MNQLRIINSSIDCILKFRATKYPLKNIASDIIKARKLNSQERKYFLDLVFSWARNSHLVIKFLKQELRFFDGLSNQQRDALVLKVLAEPSEDQALRDRYDHFLHALGDERYLIALGDVISEELVKSHGQKAVQIAKGLWDAPAKYLAFDHHMVDREQVIKDLERCGIQATPHALAPNALKVQGDIQLARLPKKLASEVWMMDAGSQIIASFVNPSPHERVLDLCAGEGGKARLLAMNPGTLTVLDIDKARLQKARMRLQKYQIEFICADGTAPPLTPQSFDWVLVDAPCSGSGVLRRHPDVIHRLSRADLIKYQKLQAALLASAVKLLRPGAKLIYATCSLFACENQQQIERLMATITDLNPTNLTGKKANFLELFPHIHDCDGFFVTQLTKARE